MSNNINSYSDKTKVISYFDLVLSSLWLAGMLQLIMYSIRLTALHNKTGETPTYFLQNEIGEMVWMSWTAFGISCPVGILHLYAVIQLVISTEQGKEPEKVIWASWFWIFVTPVFLVISSMSLFFVCGWNIAIITTILFLVIYVVFVWFVYCHMQQLRRDSMTFGGRVLRI